MENPELLALRLKEAAEMAKLRQAQAAIKKTAPGPERERTRSLIDAGLEAVQEVGRQITLWWWKQPPMHLEDEMEYREAVQQVEEGLLNLGWAHPIGTKWTKRHTMTVTYHDPCGAEYTAKGVKWTAVEEFLLELPEPPVPDLDKLAREQGKTIINGEVVKLPKNVAPCDDECDKGEECPAEQAGDHRPGKCDGEAASPPENNWKEEAKDIQVTEEMIDDVAKAIGGHMVPNGDGTRSFIGDKEEPVEEKELPPLEKEPVVEIEVNSILAVLRDSEKTGKTIMIGYEDQKGNVTARMVKVIMVNEDEGRFNVYDGKSRQVREAWFIESVLQAYPSVKPIEKFGDKLKYYGKPGYTVALTPCAGPPLFRKAYNSRWATPEQAEKLLSTGNWKRLS